MRTKAGRTMPVGYSTRPGYVNHRGQVVIRNTGMPGNDRGQTVYQLGCSECGHVYGANGSDIHERRCPLHDQGKPGLEYEESLFRQGTIRQGTIEQGTREQGTREQGN